jgi:hypothetical protein
LKIEQQYKYEDRLGLDPVKVTFPKVSFFSKIHKDVPLRVSFAQSLQYSGLGKLFLKNHCEIFIACGGTVPFVVTEIDDGCRFEVKLPENNKKNTYSTLGPNED